MVKVVDADPSTVLVAEAPDAVVGEALLVLAAQIDAVTVALARAAAEARGEWRGPHRDHFDAERSRREVQASAVIASCRRLAAQ